MLFEGCGSRQGASANAHEFTTYPIWIHETGVPATQYLGLGLDDSKLFLNTPNQWTMRQTLFTWQCAGLV
jgi:hypothetical protein